MPNIKSAKKRVRINEAKAMRNKAVKSDLKTALKKADLAVANNADDKEVVIKTAIKKVDMACSKGILHKNNASRKKSALAKSLNK
jgi:small subunit ribosomal protein S20